MGKRDGSGSSNQAGSVKSAGEKKPKAKRQSTSAIQYARDLSKNDNTEHMEKMKNKLLNSTYGFDDGSAVYRIIYSNGAEAIVTFKNGNYTVQNPDEPTKKYSKFGLDGIKYISKATKSKFSDSLGFTTGAGNEKVEKIYAKEKTFNAYNNEVKKLFKKKKRKSTTKKSTSTKKKSTAPKSTPKNTAAKPKTWEKVRKL